MTHIKFYSMAFAFIMLNACAKEGDLGSFRLADIIEKIQKDVEEKK